jgi:hypothetical protein
MPVLRLPRRRSLCQAESIPELPELVILGPAPYDFHRPILVSLELHSQPFILDAQSAIFRAQCLDVGGHATILAQCWRSHWRGATA